MRDEWEDMVYNLVTEKVIQRRQSNHSKNVFSEYKVKGRVFQILGEAAVWSADYGNAAMDAIVLKPCSRDTVRSGRRSNGEVGLYYVYNFKGAPLIPGSKPFSNMREVDALSMAKDENEFMDKSGRRTPEKVEKRLMAYQENMRAMLIAREKEKILRDRKRAKEAVKFKDVQGSW